MSCSGVSELGLSLGSELGLELDAPEARDQTQDAYYPYCPLLGVTASGDVIAIREVRHRCQHRWPLRSP